MQDVHANQPVHTRGPDLPDATAAMIMVHGRGADAASILALADELDVKDVAYLAPQAAGGTWYPYSFLAPWDQNEPGISSGLAAIGRALERVRAAGLPDKKIMLLGFSQGACLTSEFVARHPARYGGVFILTGGLIGQQISPRDTHSGSFDGCPILLATGDPDPHVPFPRVQETAELFLDMGAEVELVRYPGRPHTVSGDEIERIRTSVRKIVGS